MHLSIQNLCKTYSNGITALKDVSLDISTGLFGLLGPNGAGKTTLMRTIATLQDADSGDIQFDDIDVLRQKMEIKKILGYLPQDFDFYPKDTAYQLFDHFTLLRGIKNKKQRKARVEELLTRANLWKERHQKLGTFSGGMKQRFGIALALIGNPRLLIVDEPTAGLDPEERVRFHNLLSEISEKVVVILSTHIVDDVSDLCPNLAIIRQGEIILKENTLHSVNQLEGKIWEKQVPKNELPSYQEKFRVISTHLLAGKTLIRIYSGTNPESGFRHSNPVLQDVYFYHLQRAGV